MARFAGRNSAVIVEGVGKLPFVTSYTLDGQTDQLDGTAFGDRNKITHAGLPGAQGTVEGWKDKGKKILMDLARSGVAAKSYFYEDLENDPTNYFACEANWSMSLNNAVNQMARWSANWSATTDIVDGPGVS